jgi:hypothetical protein
MEGVTLGDDVGVADGSNMPPPDLNVPPPRVTEAMFYGLVGDVARAAAKDTEVNPVAAAIAFLSFLGANVGRDVYLAIGNTWHRPVLFTMHMGRSGRGRKGDAIRLVCRIADWIETHYAGNVGQRHSGGLSTREGLAWLIHDGYKDGKQEIEPIRDKRLWVIESEFANVLHQAKRDGNTLSSCLRDVWDGQSIKPATKSSRIWASDPAVGIHGCITPCELLNLLESREMSNGFANRFLMIWAEKTGSIPFPQPTPQDLLETLSRRTGDVIAFAKGAYPDIKDSRKIHFSDAASILYAEVYSTELDRPQSSELLTALLERQAPYTCRLAALFALSDRTLLIEERHLIAALAWVRYAKESVRYVFATITSAEADEQRDKMAEKITAFLKGFPDGVTRTQLVNDCFQKHGSAERIDDALQSLMTATPPIIELIERPRENGRPGNPTKIYRLLTSTRRGMCGISGNRATARDSEIPKVAESGGICGMRSAASANPPDAETTFRNSPHSFRNAVTQAPQGNPHNPHIPQGVDRKHDPQNGQFGPVNGLDDVGII